MGGSMREFRREGRGRVLFTFSAEPVCTYERAGKKCGYTNVHGTVLL